MPELRIYFYLQTDRTNVSPLKCFVACSPRFGSIVRVPNAGRLAADPLRFHY
jgi:hypothetical protein